MSETRQNREHTYDENENRPQEAGSPGQAPDEEAAVEATAGQAAPAAAPSGETAAPGSAQAAPDAAPAPAGGAEPEPAEATAEEAAPAPEETPDGAPAPDEGAAADEEPEASTPDDAPAPDTEAPSDKEPDAALAGAPEEAPDTAENGGEETPETPPDEEAENRRLAEMTRTVQVSVEQILARMETERSQAPQPEPPQPPAQREPAEEAEEEEPRRSLGARIGFGMLHGVWGIVKWLLLVVLLVGVITGVSVWWLYKNATADLLPQIQATFGGQTLEPTEYEWRIPIVNDLFTREYQFKADSVPGLAEPLGALRPKLAVTPSNYETQFTVWDASGDEVFNGSAPEFGNFRLAGSGQYRGCLVVSDEHENFSGAAQVMGHQEYEFTFAVNMKPSVRTDKGSVSQGDVLAVILTGIQEDDVPTLDCEIASIGFLPSSNGWVAYLPIPYDQKPGNYTAQVHTGSFVQDVNFAVREQAWLQLDHSSTSQLIAPYLGPEDIPEKVLDVLDIYDTTLYWADGGFALPFEDGGRLKLAYGTQEYVGRSAAQREAGTGSGRATINTLFQVSGSIPLTAPAAGRVVLAEKLDKTDGTIVIEHGGGVKSILYRLDSVDVKVGDMVTLGQHIGVTSGHYIVEVRVGDVPVDPINIWAGQCNAMHCT